MFQCGAPDRLILCLGLFSKNCFIFCPTFVARSCEPHLVWIEVVITIYGIYSAVFEKVFILGISGGYISSQCRIRSTQWPAGMSMGVVNSGNAPGLNSRTSACGPSVRSRRTAALGGTTRGSRVAPGEPPQTRLVPWFSRSLGPLGHPPRPSLSLVGLRRLFGTCFLPTGGHLHLRGQNNDFPRSGRNQESMRLEGAVQGPPMDPSDGPLAGLVEHNT